MSRRHPRNLDAKSRLFDFTAPIQEQFKFANQYASEMLVLDGKVSENTLRAFLKAYWYDNQVLDALIQNCTGVDSTEATAELIEANDALSEAAMVSAMDAAIVQGGANGELDCADGASAGDRTTADWDSINATMFALDATNTEADTSASFDSIIDRGSAVDAANAEDDADWDSLNDRVSAMDGVIAQNGTLSERDRNNAGVGAIDKARTTNGANAECEWHDSSPRRLDMYTSLNSGFDIFSEDIVCEETHQRRAQRQRAKSEPSPSVDLSACGGSTSALIQTAINTKRGVFRAATGWMSPSPNGLKHS